MSKRSALTLTLSLKGEGINGWALSNSYWIAANVSVKQAPPDA
jgi:hypothetical protein